MGWIDRDYSRPKKQSFGSTVLQLLNGSVSLGEWFGIEVRVHAILIILIASRVLFAGSKGGLGMRNALTSSFALFAIILLHEFGHCYAAHLVGGRARHILLWPLGGLASVEHPQRPWPSFVTSVGGPLVNVLICAIAGLGLKLMSGFHFPLPLNPLLPFSSAEALGVQESYRLIYENTLAYNLWWIYLLSLSLLLFNLLPIFPLDGGQMLQAILWPKFGFYNSMNFACITGMVGAALLTLMGLIGNTWFLVLGVSGFMVCYQTRMNLSALSQQAWEDSQYMTSGYSVPRFPRSKSSSRSSTSAKSPKRPHDDAFSWRDLNPIERFARARRKKQFQRLFDDDK